MEGGGCAGEKSAVRSGKERDSTRVLVSDLRIKGRRVWREGVNAFRSSQKEGMLEQTAAPSRTWETGR